MFNGINRRKFPMGDLYRTAKFVNHLMACNSSLLVIEYPAHHACVYRDGEGRGGAAHPPKTIKLLNACITSLFFRADDRDKIFSIIIAHGHVGSEQRWIDNVQSFNHSAVWVDPTAKVLVRAIRCTFKLNLLHALEVLFHLRGELSQVPSGCGGAGFGQSLK